MEQFLSLKIIKKAKAMLSKQSKHVEEQSKFYSALANPTRLQILLLLRTYKDVCPSDIADILGVSASAVSHQARQLEHLGLVKRVRKGKTICYLEGENLPSITL